MDARFSHILDGWFKKFQRYKVGYRNGAYHLSNLFHSPETIVASFDSMPFCKHYREQNHQVCNNIFVKSTMYYCHLDDGLWVMPSNLYFKKNVLMRNLYDDNLPLEYHFINIHIKSTPLVNKSMVNGLVLKGRTWSMFKAGQAVTEYHFKNSDERNITVFFTSKWLEQQIQTNPTFGCSKLVDFFDSENGSLILDEKDTIYETIWNEIMQLADDGVVKNFESIKKITYDVLFHFIEKLNSEVISENHFKLSDSDRKNIQRVEQFLNANLFGDFPGIEKTAQKVGISPTKLKNDFKSMHDASVYQYFSGCQMQAARELLLLKEHTVKEVANLFGYENASKFSAVFKKTFDLNPSDL